MTNNNQKARIRAYMNTHKVNYTTALRALSGPPSDYPSGPVALVRETWPIPDRNDVWDGDLLQVVVDCPSCGDDHLHGGRVSDGPNHGVRSPHCHSGRRTVESYTIYDNRKRRTVSPSPEPMRHFAGVWPGDPEPTVDTVAELVERDEGAAIDYIRSRPNLPPVTLRAAWEAGLGWEGEYVVAAAQVIVDHAGTPRDVRDDAVSEIESSGDVRELVVLAGSPAMKQSNLANRLVGRDCAGDHSVLLALTANPEVTADSLGWASEHATGFMHGEADVALARQIVTHPNLDEEVWGFFAQRAEECGAVLLESPHCDVRTGQHVLADGAANGDREAVAKAIEFLTGKAPEGQKALAGWLQWDDEDAPQWALDAVRAVVDRA